MPTGQRVRSQDQPTLNHFSHPAGTPNPRPRPRSTPMRQPCARLLLKRQSTIIQTRPDPNTPLRRPVRTNPSHRAARDTVTGPNGQTAHHPQNPIPQNQSHRPAGTPEIETGITSREKHQIGIKSRIKSAHKAHKYEESRKPLFHKNLRLSSKNSGRQDSNLRLLGPKSWKYLFIYLLVLSVNLNKNP